ncbi:hypothetical protein B0H13DRAFT_2301035 [Mycena leptocephala]|nr:hypothetical protein B0H13DRAFT_2301035 [Mycena leptocephala]
MAATERSSSPPTRSKTPSTYYHLWGRGPCNDLSPDDPSLEELLEIMGNNPSWRPPLPLLDKQNFQKAAYTFLRVGSTKDFGDWMGKVPPAFLSPRHLRVLCALAILLCPALKTQIFENSTFGVYVELAPYVRELVGAHLSRTFKAVLELLNRYSWRHALDIYLAPRVTELMNMIRNWVVAARRPPGRAHVADGSRIAVEGCLATRSTICALSRSLPPRINRPSRLKDDGEDLIYLL